MISTLDPPTRTLADIEAERYNKARRIRRAIERDQAMNLARHRRERAIRLALCHRAGVVNERTGQYFRSTVIAAEAYGFDRGEMIVASLKRPHVMAAGCFWRYATADEFLAGRSLLPPSRTPRENRCGFIHCADGTWHRNLDAASAATGESRSNIHKCLRTGLRWRRATGQEWLSHNSPSQTQEPKRRLANSTEASR